MLSKSRYREDIRVRREAEALSAAGHVITVMSVDDTEFAEAGILVRGIGPVGGLQPRLWEPPRSIPFRALRWLLLPEHRHRALRQFHRRAIEMARRLDSSFDVVHAHDLPALRAGADLADLWDAALVYDAHEYWPGVPRHGRPEPIRRFKRDRQAGVAARRADLVITVSLGAAKLLRERYGLRNIAVVRNTFPPRYDLQAPPHPRGAVYAGRIGPGRDLETVVSADIWKTIGLELHLMGPVDISYVLEGDFELHPIGTIDEVDQLLTVMGIALVPLSKGPINHEIALPNKLFQAIAAGVPAVCADLPEIAKLVRSTGVGVVYTPGDPTSLLNALETIVAEYRRFVDAVRVAREELNWANDAARLVSAYRALAHRRLRGLRMEIPRSG
ncbi:MAG: hypothetical protein KatS3mg011_1064 [Acidimicrobiia bacterium]|nr:MAG: hypothetical protein KatS3mg011_1064 [Acidimicrobiia bacterium]